MRCAGPRSGATRAGVAWGDRSDLFAGCERLSAAEEPLDGARIADAGASHTGEIGHRPRPKLSHSVREVVLVDVRAASWFQASCARARLRRRHPSVSCSAHEQALAAVRRRGRSSREPRASTVRTTPPEACVQRTRARARRGATPCATRTRARLGRQHLERACSAHVLSAARRRVRRSREHGWDHSTWSVRATRTSKRSPPCDALGAAHASRTRAVRTTTPEASVQRARALRGAQPRAELRESRTTMRSPRARAKREQSST